MAPAEISPINQLAAVAQLPPNPMRVRLNVEQTDASVLASAYETMQNRSESDNRSWVYWAEFHGFNRFDCWHHGSQGSQHYPWDLFLPWHRAYLLYFEQIAFAEVSAAIGLPWWDWTSGRSHQNGLPNAFTTQPALETGPVPPALRTTPPRTTRSHGPPSELPTVQTIDSILALATFEDFSNQLQNQHDFIHGWTGGDMGVVATSAFDPIFWAHHCMIDRLWYLWQLRHGVDNIPPSYLTQVLAPWKLTVADVLSIAHLGYTYALGRTNVAALPAFAASEL
jgi:tyrosinase